MPTVKIAGVQPQQVLDVRDVSSEDGSDLGNGYIDMVDSAFNRSSFGPGDDVTIDWGGGISWRGEVVGQPSSSNGTLSYRALGEALPLKHEQAYRTVYEAESSEVVKALAQEQTEQLPAVQVHTGDDPSNWTSIAPIAEAYAGDRASIYEFGTDLLVLGARDGHSGELRTTYDAVPSSVADFWSLVVEFRTPGGTSYRWEPDLEAGAHTYELAAEAATPEDSGLSTGELRYRLLPGGVVSGTVAVGIDHAATIPCATSSRPNPPGIGSVDATGRTITRRIDGSVGEAIDRIATEDGATWYIQDNDLYYLVDGSASTAALSIDQSTPVVDVNANRDFEDIRNVVTVQGSDGVEVVERAQSSIDFYGALARPEPIADPSLRTDREARDRAQGFLDARAWNDAEVDFAVADLGFAQLDAGDLLPVTWPAEGLDGQYEVGSVTVQPKGRTGIVRVTVQASTARN